MDRAFFLITQDDFHKAKSKGPKSLINKDFKKNHEIYNATVAYASGKYYLTFDYEKKIYKDLLIL